MLSPNVVSRLDGGRGGHADSVVKKSDSAGIRIPREAVAGRIGSDAGCGEKRRYEKESVRRQRRTSRRDGRREERDGRDVDGEARSDMFEK